jgi:hypothetical protein
MKHYFLIWISLLLLNSSAFAQSNEDKLAFVRKHFYATENSLNELIEKTYIYKPYEYPPWGYYSFWFNDKGELLKAEYSFGEEGFGSRESCYFDEEGEMVFIVIKDYEPHWDEVGSASQVISEERIYLSEGEIFEYFVREQSEDNLPDIDDIPQKKKDWTAVKQDKILRCAKLIRNYEALAN